uniref:Uncharacterized protein n=1 Tax=Ciona intestinalis TaxID=7719 RepID=H2Y081_CIOIN
MLYSMACHSTRDLGHSWLMTLCFGPSKSFTLQIKMKCKMTYKLRKSR